MFLVRGFFTFVTQFRFKKYLFLRENNMVLNGAMDQEDLALIPVNGFEPVYKTENPPPAFIFSDDDDINDDEDFEDDEFEDEDDDFGDDDDDLDDDEEDEDDNYDEEDDDYDEDDDWGEDDE
jgi:hypothetical protein